MKQFYFAVLFFSYSLFTIAQTNPTGSQREQGVTDGSLGVTTYGGASYAIPIAVAPGINGVVPQLSLSYNSQGAIGPAGYGWNISGVSAISRIPATTFHDNKIDAVDFNSWDRFALDGQRLIVKSGNADSYGLNGTVYETENFSNIRVTSYGVHPSGVSYGPAYFLVEYPDGSKAYYGNSTDSRSITDWSVTYWENAQGLRISYNYSLSNNLLEITSIKYGSKSTATPINEVQFTYETRARAENYYVGGQLIKRVNRLKEIRSLGNSVGFRNYVLDYAMAESSEKYDRLYSITEKSGDKTKSYNPTIFSYNNTDNAISYVSNPNTLSVDNVSSLNASSVSGDFDGDGNMDFILYPTTGADAKAKYWLFSGINPNSGAQTIPNFGLAQQPGLFEEIIPVTWLSWNNKIMYSQGWTIVKTNTSTNLTSLQTYSTDPSNFIYPQHLKSFTFPKLTYYSEHPLSCVQNRPPISHTENIPKRYIGGDYNGDGITDVAIVEINFTYSYLGPCDSNDQPLSVTDTYYGDSYFMNMDPRITSNYTNKAGILNASSSSKIYVADFNGDGKSDIYIFDVGKVKVYSLNESKQFSLLYQSPTTDSSLVLNKPLVMGDFNGDGKSDFMLPVESNNGWYRYLSTGISFVKETRNIAWVVPNDSSNSYNYFATDYDNDGKSDLTVVKNSRNSSTGLGTIQVTAITEMGPTSFNVPTATTEARSDINIYALPIYLPTADKQHPRFEIAFINNNKLHFFNAKKDTNKDRLLTIITTGNGVQQFISYQPLDQIYKINYNSVYNSSQGTETYPYFDIVASPDFQIVTKLEKKSATSSKMKLYGYYGAVTNYEGLGFMGFRSTMESSWHDTANPGLCTVTNRDFKKRGAVTESYFLTSVTYPYNGFNPSNFTGKSVFTYSPANDQALLPNKVFKLQNTGSIVYNQEENTNVETTTTYNENSNPLTTQKVIKEGSTVVETEIEGVEYENPNPTTPYIIDRPYSKGISKQRGNMLSGYAEMYEYDSNNLLYFSENYTYGTQSSGEGFNESFLYDAFGNLTKKTVFAGSLSPRETKYEYDSSGRFLTKITDNDNLFSTFEYDINNGLLKKETNPYSLSTSYTYDSWFRELTVKDDQLNKLLTYSYSNTYAAAAGSESTITTTTDALDGTVIEEKFDALGRKTRSGLKNIQGVFSYTSYLYDNLDRNYKVSEPYFGTTPSQWNETKFDMYSRPTQNISFNNRSIIVGYSGLTSSVTDGQRTKTSIKNATGDIVSTNETTGGTITYTYFPGGNLKQTSYNGMNVTMEQDGLGRKTKLTDPSAGTFTYKYNELGELMEETSQNGNVKTTFVRDDGGRPTKKTILGGGTNSETLYTYNALKLPSTITYEDKNEPVGTNKTITTLTYDPVFKRIITVTEDKTGVSKFTKSLTYDALGRIDTETKLAEVGGKSSSVLTKNVYQNGDLYQILDVNNKVIWQTTTVDAKKQILESQMGNGIKMTNSYDTDGYLSTIQHDKTTTPTGTILKLTTAFDKNNDNLNNRTNSAFGNFTETFKYDEINRLKEYTNKLGVQQSQTYDASGKILTNNIGGYSYDPVLKYQNTSISPSAEVYSYFVNREGIFSDGMESNSGWTLNPYNPQCISYDLSKGSGSVKFNTTLASDGICYVQSDVAVPIDNIADTQYTFSGWIYSEGPTAQLTLFQYNANETGYYSYVSSANSTTKNAWSKIEMTVSVPASVKSLRLRLDGIGAGNVWFDSVKIRKTSDPVTPPLKKLSVTYNGLKTPSQIEEIGLDKINFTYNDDNQRSTMYYGGFQDNKLLRPLQKHYSADGTMEVKQNIVTGNMEFITYIGGDGYSAPIVVKSDGVNPANYLYLHRDYQGSIVTITNDNGAVIEKRLFDAWGSILKVTDGSGNSLNGLTVLDRGYTGHEHLQSVGLINMNSRLYDPKLHRFLSADNYIQDVTNTQNYNQYGYVLNNPLMYTDPSGNQYSDGKDCIDCGPSEGQQTLIGSLIGTLVTNWDSWRIKDWSNKNLNFKKWDYWRKEKISLRNIFGGGHKNSTPAPPPNLSNYIDLGDSTTNNNLATTASLLGGASGVMNELSVVKFYNSAPAGFFAANYNGMQVYWKEAFNGGTKAQIAYSFVQTAKNNTNAMKLLTKYGRYANTVGSYAGYYGAFDNLVHGDYYGAARETAANYTGIRIAAARGNVAGIGWTIGWNILGPMVTNSELYNRIFFGKNSAVYQDRERQNGWYESKIFKD